jgi:hypothetical protein
MSKQGLFVPKATVAFDQYGSFVYNYKIPNNTPLGNYTIIAQVPFGAYYAYFNVVDKLPVQNMTIPENQTQSTVNQTSNTTVNTTPTTVPSTIGPIQRHSQSPGILIDKINKLPQSVIAVELNSKSVESATYYPRELDGLLRVNPGDENSISVKVSSQDGTCIIGQDSGCKITKSTANSGLLYQTVTVNGMDYLVGYTGTGVRLEQFSIMPAHAGDVIPNGEWGVEIIKKDQTTRFYYQVTYVAK